MTVFLVVLSVTDALICFWISFTVTYLLVKRIFTLKA